LTFAYLFSIPTSIASFFWDHALYESFVQFLLCLCKRTQTKSILGLQLDIYMIIFKINEKAPWLQKTKLQTRLLVGERQVRELVLCSSPSLQPFPMCMVWSELSICTSWTLTLPGGY
jgi:hypothetical protein